MAKIVLLSENFQDFFKYVQHPQFDIAADAFSTFKDLLSRHKNIASQYLNNNFDAFFQKYNLLLQSNNFVTKLIALKLLNDLLHTGLVISYISTEEESLSIISEKWLMDNKCFAHA